MPKTKHATPISSIILALICTIFSATGQLFYKLGSGKIVDIIKIGRRRPTPH